MKWTIVSPKSHNKQSLSSGRLFLYLLVRFFPLGVLVVRTYAIWLLCPRFSYGWEPGLETPLASCFVSLCLSLKLRQNPPKIN